MRRICHACRGTGVVSAERFYLRDAMEMPITGPITCPLCSGRGQFDDAGHERHAWNMEQRQVALRQLIDLGGSPYSAESRFFDVTEIRWNAITSVYFRPKAILALLGMVFPGDAEDMAAAVQYASWGHSTGWRVSAADDDPDDPIQHPEFRLKAARIRYCKRIESMLWDQVRVHDWPVLTDPFPRNDTAYVPLQDLRTDCHYIRRGYTPVTSWRAAVEAVRTASTAAAAA